METTVSSLFGEIVLTALSSFMPLWEADQSLDTGVSQN